MTSWGGGGDLECETLGRFRQLHSGGEDYLFGAAAPETSAASHNRVNRYLPLLVHRARSKFVRRLSIRVPTYLISDP